MASDRVQNHNFVWKTNPLQCDSVTGHNYQKYSFTLQNSDITFQAFQNNDNDFLLWNWQFFLPVMPIASLRKLNLVLWLDDVSPRKKNLRYLLLVKLGAINLRFKY